MLLNAFRRLFSNSPNRKARRASGSPRLELLSLEQRINPATFAYTGGILTIDLNQADDFRMTSLGGGNYKFYSNKDIFTGKDITGLSGNESGTLTITSDLALTNVNITDSTSTGAKVKFDASTGAYVDNFSIVLDKTPGAVTVYSDTTFSGAASLTVNTTGSVSFSIFD